MKLRCPVCREAFPWKAEEPFPSHCMVCRAYIGHNRADDDVVMPFFRSAKMSRTDQVYRDIEAGSEKRVHLAAEAAGCDPSDMAALKITDMNDRSDAEIAYKESSDAESRLKQAAPQSQIGFQPNGSEYAAGIATGAVTVNGKTVQGIEPRAGARAVQNVHRLMGR